jgi:hypothetical protein
MKINATKRETTDLLMLEQTATSISESLNIIEKMAQIGSGMKSRHFAYFRGITYLVATVGLYIILVELDYNENN